MARGAEPAATAPGPAVVEGVGAARAGVDGVVVVDGVGPFAEAVAAGGGGCILETVATVTRVPLLPVEGPVAAALGGRGLDAPLESVRKVFVAGIAGSIRAP